MNPSNEETKVVKAIKEGLVKNEKEAALFQIIEEAKNDLVQAIKDIPSVEIPDQKDFPTSLEISNLPEIQKVEITNFPEQKEPIVNVSPTPVTVNQSDITVDTKQVADEVAKLDESLGKILIQVTKDENNIDKVMLVDENGKPIDLEKLGGGNRQGGVISGTFTIADEIKRTSYLSGTSANGTRDLTSASTWYAVPSTVPTSPYILVATVENSVGTVRFAFDNTGTPSSTNGNQAPSQLTVRLAANQVIYYASSSAGDDVNWTTKVI